MSHTRRCSVSAGPSWTTTRPYVDVCGFIFFVYGRSLICNQNFHSDPAVQGEHYNSVPGAYDQWAIEYGYVVIEGGEPIDRQHPTLATIAARGTIPELEGEVDTIVMSPRLVYGTDEGGPGVDGEDPYLNVREHYDALCCLWACAAFRRCAACGCCAACVA